MLRPNKTKDSHARTKPTCTPASPPSFHSFELLYCLTVLCYHRHVILLIMSTTNMYHARVSGPHFQRLPRSQRLLARVNAPQPQSSGLRRDQARLFFARVLRLADNAPAWSCVSTPDERRCPPSRLTAHTGSCSRPVSASHVYLPGWEIGVSKQSLRAGMAE